MRLKLDHLGLSLCVYITCLGNLLIHDIDHAVSHLEIDVLSVITISPGCFERCCRNKKTLPYQSNLSFATLNPTGVRMGYRPGLPDVLCDLNLTILAREKVGIVGRTGAGKSSILVALFRMGELRSGTIHIDGVDTVSRIGIPAYIYIYVYYIYIYI